MHDRHRLRPHHYHRTHHPRRDPRRSLDYSNGSRQDARPGRPRLIVFASMGLFLAQVVPANAAPGIVNIIYLPMSFLGGLWIPLSQLPHWVRSIASVMPTYHLAQLMLGIFGRGYRFDDVSTPTHWFGLIGFACLMLGSAWAV